MALNQRRVKILHLIREDGHAKVQDLSKIFNVTDVTIRQDLEALEQMGYIQREHGGAFLKGVGSFAKTGQLFNQTHLEEKKEIAQKAIQFIQEGDSIILDSGSTTTEIAKLLMNYKDLTVITNALNIALILGENHGINLIVTGGEFKAPTLSLTGKMAADSFKDIRANKLFLATAGISSDMKLTYPSLSDLVVKSAMIESASKVYLVADCSKIGVSAFASLGSVSLANAIITDSTITEEDFERLKEIKEKTKMPLVLHGGSGSGDENIKRCVEFGINKINVGCDFMNANVDSIKQHLKKDPDINYWVMMHQVEIDSQELVKKYIHLSGSEGKSL